LLCVSVMVRTLLQSIRATLIGRCDRNSIAVPETAVTHFCGYRRG